MSGLQSSLRKGKGFSGSLRARTLQVIGEARALLESGITLSAEYGKRCKACSLVEICQPRLLEKDRSVGYVAGLFEGDM